MSNRARWLGIIPFEDIIDMAIALAVPNRPEGWRCICGKFHRFTPYQKAMFDQRREAMCTACKRHYEIVRGHALERSLVKR